MNYELTTRQNKLITQSSNGLSLNVADLNATIHQTLVAPATLDDTELSIAITDVEEELEMLVGKYRAHLRLIEQARAKL